MHFSLEKQDANSSARAGLLTTGHGVVPTPIFMPVGTLGTVKGLHQRELLQDLDAPIILANTYHLYLRPGVNTLRSVGGLHAFMGWPRALLTDSGGYQVHSLAHQRRISEAGVEFRSHLDGSKHLLTPEKAIDIQRAIGADIVMAFDECTPDGCSYAYAKDSMERTHRWLWRCQQQMARTQAQALHEQSLFPIVQGSIYKELRVQATEHIASQPAAGYAIGGVCHPTGHLYEVTGWVCERLPRERPRYLMGVGTPQDLLECIALGVDMFDCVMPSRNARNGTLFTTKGMVNMRNSRWAGSLEPVDAGLQGYASRCYSKGYLHHLVRCGERLGAQIATLQNLSLYLWLVRSARAHILQGTFTGWKAQVLPRLMRKL